MGRVLNSCRIARPCNLQLEQLPLECGASTTLSYQDVSWRKLSYQAVQVCSAADNRGSSRSLTAKLLLSLMKFRSQMQRHANMEKNRFETGSVCRVLGFVWMVLSSWIRIPRVRSETSHLVSLGGYPKYPSGCTPMQVQFPLLRWDDDDRWETVSNVDVCVNVQTCVKQTESVWTQVHWSWKNHMWHGCSVWLFGVYGQWFFTAPLPLPCDDQRWNQRDQCFTNNPSLRAPMTHDTNRVFCAQVSNLVVVWILIGWVGILVGTCLDLTWHSLDLSCCKR